MRVRVQVSKRLYNLQDEQIEYQLLDLMSYQRFEHVLDEGNTVERSMQTRPTRQNAGGKCSRHWAGAMICSAGRVGINP